MKMYKEILIVCLFDEFDKINGEFYCFLLREDWLFVKERIFYFNEFI